MAENETPKAAKVRPKCERCGQPTSDGIIVCRTCADELGKVRT